MNSDLALADFIDRCLWRYQKQPSYRQTLERERPDHRPKTIHLRRTA